MSRTITILGSTGSIGTSTLDVVAGNPEEYRVAALAAGNNLDLLCRQIEQFRPELVSVATEEGAQAVKSRFGSSVEVLVGQEGLVAVATHEAAEVVVTAVVGAAGLLPTLEALKKGKHIALANKETLVAAGHLVTDLAKHKGCALLPVDSEHSAIFQCLNGERRSDVERILVTASGGPFRDKTREEMAQATLQNALNHPNWAMGAKITIDSATLMNKGLEVIEAHWLFDMPYDQIDVLVHPESVVHSLVEFVDGSIMAQLGAPDMRVPIQYALTYPTRRPAQYKRLNLLEASSLHFRAPDLDRFPCLRYAYDAGRIGGSMPAVLNAANEVANALFRDERISFLDIERVNATVMERHDVLGNPSLEDILSADAWARATAREVAQKL
ncbi:1-deoxy-D-xylulose-5-phosphate reductoisomerase [Tumebacillus flagellatus]|uniref:1-deoxy-D-xylulose 5-phosphate reductoisomerase n=1 Tax=Tumebacillus flagellatus TaxID=1157490 RepID=A0A074LSY7_9BACL|nr:1-deoxy-D-xylulose-5-phosphate reductoisomerase [Tumebacillus flagellatus]KEO82968.1 1-deoxy-D-xylulose 5-phosphate reductoisomerase [Tumebacillus flagellatus]